MLLYSVSSAYAQQVELKDSEKSYVISYPLYLVDKNNNLKPGQILNNTNFKPAKFPTLSLGATTASVWVKTHIVNHSKKTDWHIQINSPPVLQLVEVYQKQSNQLVKIFTSYANKPKSAGDVRVNNLLIPISIPTGSETEYYIRATSNNILRLPLKITTLQKTFEQEYLPDLLNGITFGMLMAFALYNLFVYILTKEQPYLYYLGYILFWSLNLFFYNGFLPDIFTSLIWLNSAGTIISIASLLSVFFTNSFLQTKKNSPFFYQIRGLMSFLSLLILFTDIFWKGAYSFILIQYLMYPFFFYWFGAGILSLRNGYKPALYFILGFGCLMLGNAVYSLKDLDVLPDNLFTRTSMHWGTLLEALILSFALASRLNFYQREKEQIQIKSIEEKRNFLKELLKRQEQEKKRIAMELHDNIGQQLILIKNKSWRLQQLSEQPLKEEVTHSIDHVAEIMVSVRSILHRLRPYQMDLLGLTQSINGMIAEAFADYHLEHEKTDDINQLFNSDESMHIFRIIQLLTDGILSSVPFNQINFTITRLDSYVEFQFDLTGHQQPLGNFPDINNRLELLNGTLNRTGTSINVCIPYSSKN
ncbi:7TM diverse intracellular signaling domain-containing protein [Pedobacter nyackensis]|uniref:sensor histidine kinase n=1 Tax=Pedobacter nyackensis TaxID=475255 RepID=UPI00292EBED8|nr:7TM diverse intracellular signaling domain-containing protein [Pedobacter nyackensis]